MKKLLISLMLICFGHLTLHAHNFWASKHENRLKLYFGDWEDNIKEKGEKLKFIQTDVILPQNSTKTITQHNDHIAIELNMLDDVVVINTKEPRKSKVDNTISQTIIAMRAGRENPMALATLDVLPAKPNSNTFTLMFNNQPLPKTKITLYSPTTWSKTFQSDDTGKFTIHTPWQGEYMMELKYNDGLSGQINGKSFDSTNYTTTVTFHVAQGVAWGKVTKSMKGE